MRMARSVGSRRINLLFGCLQSFFWSANCVYFSFLVLYLNKIGQTDKTISFLMMMLSMITVITPSVVGYLSDFVIPIKRIVAGFMLFSIPAAFFLKFSAGCIPLIFLSVACMGILEKSLVSVIDSWAMKIQPKYPGFNYGLTRGLASLVYGLVGLLMGSFFDKLGLDKLFYVHGVFALGAFLSAMFLDHIEIHKKDVLIHEAGRGWSQNYPEVLFALLKSPRYFLLVVSMMLAGIALVSTYTYQPLLLAEMGGTNRHLGMSLFVMASSEVPIMLGYNKLSEKIANDRLLMIAFFFTVLRVVSHLLVPDLAWLIGIQVIQSLSFGLFLPSVLAYIGEITDARVTASAITFAMACYEGLSGMLGNFVGGMIADLFGLRMVYVFFGIVAMAAFATLSISVLKYK